MAKIKPHLIDKKERYEMIGNFYDIVTDLKTKKDVIGFFMGLLTPSEALMFARRIQIAFMLLEEKSYAEIKKELHVGTSTIVSVYNWLFDEDAQFKKHISKHAEKKKGAKKKQGNADPENLLNKYPHHRILKDLLRL
jgi:uncharacterized protein YerC